MSYEGIICHCCLQQSSDHGINLFVFDEDYGTLVCTKCWYQLNLAELGV